ncbi:ATP-binding protein [Microvirga arsenatis]|uniref:ATPase AAA-type core domain-containing protein n=1 Tax=Microvirga arsenatis TaxID=2692265 RepID=A0ABW9Z3G6_9HYPH|nr:hypothetical protein [Microvirga arsenatis]NBJ13472.1 hypothetical protein [Microvirga arsenatis]NBJ26990.1 hypothetical protein [Microvirga arsenatis]
MASFIGYVLEEVDGLRPQPGVVMIGVTNFPKAVDPALLRSGWLERVIHVLFPSTEELAQTLRQKLASDLPGADLKQPRLRRFPGASPPVCRTRGWA